MESGINYVRFLCIFLVWIIINKQYSLNVPDVIHIATHGYFCESKDKREKLKMRNPLMSSGIILAGANNADYESNSASISNNDGILSAMELSLLDLAGTKLVVLSACETGLGEIITGEGVLGLRQGFKQAGTNSVLMSLWKIPDLETAILMKLFCENISCGKTKKQSLKNAFLSRIKSCREKYGSGHPLLWSGFVLFGDPY